MLASIVAMDKNGAIGQGNEMPWHLPNDLKYFKEVTSDSVVLMGRKTFESIGNKLPNRINVVLTRNAKCLNETNKEDNLFFIDDVEKALLFSKKFEKKVFIIGGSEIYNHYVSLCDYLYITHIDAILDPVDAYFPKDILVGFKLIRKQKNKSNKDNVYDHTFLVYEKI
jgi:dihydrofolate reductase